MSNNIYIKRQDPIKEFFDHQRPDSFQCKTKHRSPLATPQFFQIDPVLDLR